MAGIEFAAHVCDVRRNNFSASTCGIKPGNRFTDKRYSHTRIYRSDEVSSAGILRFFLRLYHPNSDCDHNWRNRQCDDREYVRRIGLRDCLPCDMEDAIAGS